MKRPNLLFVVPDEFRPTSMGFLGEEKVITPSLDRFAAQGTAFTRVVSNAPVCSPYRGILLSGQYPHHNGVYTNCRSAAPGAHLKDEVTCLSDVMAAEGYSLGYIGKLHLHSPRVGDEIAGEGPRYDGVTWDAYTPPGQARHGFDYWYSYGCCDKHNDPHYWIGDAPQDEAYEPKMWSCQHETDIAIDYLRNTKGQRDPKKPFALFVAYNPPHMPFGQVPDRYKDLYADKSPEDLLTWANLTEEGREKASPAVKDYFAQISGVDDQFGRLIDTLDEEGLGEDTLVIFTSDHGEMMGSNGLMHKGLCYDPSLLVPFVARMPGQIRSGATDDALFSTIDLAPTILSLLGVKDSTPAEWQGVDYSARIKDGTSPAADASLYLMNDCHNSLIGRRGLRTPRYTFMVDNRSGQKEHLLFDNETDPRQFENIYGRDDALARELKAVLQQMLEAAGDPMMGLMRE